MEIKTKFKLDDSVYFMFNNKIQQCQIVGISTLTGIQPTNSGGSISAAEGRSIVNYYFEEFSSKPFIEEDLFTSKEELIEHTANCFDKVTC